MEARLKCPVKATARALAGKWKVSIVWHLSSSSRRFAEIRKLLPGVSDKVLTEQLRQLERSGIVLRTVTPSASPRVDYELSSAGKDLVPIMQAMCDWGSMHLGIVPNLPRVVPTPVQTVS